MPFLCTRYRVLPRATQWPARAAAAAVEFAIVLPLLITMMLGMIELTRALQVKNYLADAARSGCRAAIQPGKMPQDATNSINGILSSYGIPTASPPTTIQIQVGVGTPPATWVDWDGANALNGQPIAVSVAVQNSQVNWITPFVMGSSESLSETIVMMHQ